MKPIEKSGFFNTLNFGRIALLSYEEVLGKRGINALLHVAGLDNMIDHYPAASMDREFDFADYTAILVALEEIYGPRGGRGLAQRAGRATFKDIIDNYGAMAGVTDLAFKIMPLNMKVRLGLSRAANTFTKVSDQICILEEAPETFTWIIKRCPSCWSRTGSEKPVCYVTVGFLQSALNWVSQGRDFRVNESKCIAMGDQACEFVIQKEPLT